jgi:hypothetical protein
MSAYIVEREHIDVLVAAAIQESGGRWGEFRWWVPDEAGGFKSWHLLDPKGWGGERPEEERGPDKVGVMLWEENHKSVESRYGEVLARPPYNYRPVGFRLTIGQVFKAVDGYSYQSCEHDGWYKSEAYQFCKSLRKAYCNRVGGYEKAPWAWDATSLRAAQKGIPI